MAGVVADTTTTTTGTGWTGSPHRAAGERGTLSINPRVVTRIAEVAVRRTDGTVSRSGTLGKGLPKATARIAGDHVRVGIELAATWGRGYDALAATVRTEVATQVGELTGLVVDAVNVHIAEVSPRTSSTLAEPGAVVAAKQPARPPVSVVLLGVLVALAVGTVGVYGVRDGLRAAGLVHGRSWSDWSAGRLAVVEPAGWMTPVGIAAVVLGLVAVIAAVKPRRRREVAVGDDGDTWLRRRDVARLATQAATTVGSVVMASSRIRRRRVVVAVTSTGATDRVESEVGAVVGRRLEELRPVREVRTAVRAEGG